MAADPVFRGTPLATLPEGINRSESAMRAAAAALAKPDVKDASHQTKAADQINQSLTDALMNGFSAGKGFAQSFVDSVKAMFNTMVLRPVISAIVSSVAGAVTGAMGFSGAAFVGQSGAPPTLQ